MQIDSLFYKKLIFIYNSLNNGWCVTKKNDKYIFSKKHYKSKKIYKKKYLQTFIEKNLEIKLENNTN